MNLRLNCGILILGIIIGGFAVYKLSPDGKAPAQEIKTEIKTKIVRITEPNGTITETTVSESKQDQRVSKPKYGVAIFHDKSISLDARLGNLPLFFIIESDLNTNHRIGLRLEF